MGIFKKDKGGNFTGETVTPKKTRNEKTEQSKWAGKVKSTIPWDEKVKAVQEMVSYKMIENEESGIVYTTPYEEAVDAYIFAKYYTDVDVSEVKTIIDMGRILDMLSREEVIGVPGWVDNFDFLSIYQMCNQTIAICRKHSEEINSLSYKIGKMLNSEEQIKTLAESREVSETLIDMMKNFQKGEKRDEENPKEPALKRRKAATPKSITNLAKKDILH